MILLNWESRSQKEKGQRVLGGSRGRFAGFSIRQGIWKRCAGRPRAELVPPRAEIVSGKGLSVSLVGESAMRLPKVS